jgi:hypothetical protein
MVTATLLTLLVIPAIYSLWHEARLGRHEWVPEGAGEVQPAGAD